MARGHEMSPVSFGAALFVGAALLFCGPWLEARRAAGSLALAAGMIAGPAGTSLLPAALLDGMAPLLALSAGWLALLAAESWDLRTFRRMPARGRLALALVPPAILGAIGWILERWLSGGGAGARGLAVPMACLGLAVDPEAARHLLRLAPRPDLSARAAPARAAFALGLALLLSARAPAPLAPGRDLMSLPAGAILGLIYIAPLRFAAGRAFVQTLLLSLPLVGWGLAAWGGMSALAVIFVAGLVLANDSARRDLVFTALRELERPFTLLLLALSGASLLQGAGRPDTAVLALSIVALALVRPLCWGLTGPWRQAALGALPLSPLAIPLAMLLPAAGALGVATAVAFVLCEAAWIWMARTPA